MYLKLFFIGALITLPWATFSQSQYNDEKLLQGKWVLENVSAFEEDVQIPVSTNDLDFEPPVEMDIQQDKVVFVRKESTDTIKYDRVVMKRNWFCFPTCTVWKIVDNKLQLEWGHDINRPTGGTIIRTIVLHYSRK